MVSQDTFIDFFFFNFKLPNKEKPLAEYGRIGISLVTITASDIRSYLYRTNILAKIKVLKYHMSSYVTT